SDGNGSHASTLKSPSYTKSVSWQHYHILGVVFKSYTFTKKECRLLYSIFEGETISDLCKMNKIRKETYHAHVSNILFKVGVVRVCHLYKYKQVIYYAIMRLSRPMNTGNQFLFYKLFNLLSYIEFNVLF
ncbi:hypothetical protein ACDX32_27150, partial [Klebsiella quasipneumoniae]|uniref:hypothetical protein n=1 Tax=Klebsiella quasipneumoniae TaxID=1463165 RepID=UPI0035568D0C